MKLYRPVGLAELKLIMATDCTAFPPRLAIQPIFYPVLNFTYAEQIAQRWNTKDDVSGHVGFVTEFVIDDEFAKRYPVEIAGDRDIHQELWVPAEDLAEFNQHIIGTINVIAHYIGSGFMGTIDEKTHLPIG